MQEKSMVADTLNTINSNLKIFTDMISQSENQELRSTLQQMRNEAEQSQYELYCLAKSKNYYQPSAQASQNEINSLKSIFSGSPDSNQTSNTGIFHTGISGNSGMTGTTSMWGSSEASQQTGMTGMAGSTGISDQISMAGTTGSSESTSMDKYSRKGMNQMGMSAGAAVGPTGGISDPSNSSIEGGWSLSDLKEADYTQRKGNSFRDLD